MSSAGSSRQETLDFWRQYLDGAPPLVEVITDRHRSSNNSADFTMGCVNINLGGQLGLAVGSAAGLHGVSEHSILLTVWQVLIARYSRSDDVVVGTPVSSRECANILPVRLELPAANPAGCTPQEEQGATFLALFKRQHAQARQLLAHAASGVQFHEICSELGQDFTQSYSPVFQIFFSAACGETTPSHGARFVQCPNASPKAERCAYDLELHVSSDYTGHLAFRSSLFDPLTVERLAKHFEVLLRSAVVASGVERPWYLAELCDEEERHTVTHGVNATSAPYPATKCIHDLFEDMACERPTRPCLTFHDDANQWQTMSYGEVYCRCHAVMQHLRRLGVGPDVAVPIILERSHRQVIAIYGVLLAGGCYVPIDADYPSDRVLHMLRDANASVLITETRLLEAGKIPADFAGQTLCIDQFGSDRVDIPVAAGRRRDEIRQSPDSNVYIFYTSGTTGLPKGVEVTHRGLVKRAQWLQDSYPTTPDDKIIYKTPFTFGISEWELFWPMPFGAQVVISKEGGQKDPEYLMQAMRTQGVTLCTFVPSMLAMLIEYMNAEGLNYTTDMKHVICCGEALPVETCHKFFEVFDPDTCRLHNFYGPTEADMTYWECPKLYPGEDVPLHKIPIGKPMLNVKVYILDARGNPVPAGVPGELYFGGVTTARGYLGLPELTREKFVPNPFKAIGDCDRMYRTGDCARWMPDLSTLEFIGRVDNQVKLRGFRIELGEIESVIGSVEGITKVAVVVDGQGASARIIGYVEPKTVDVAKLVSVLKSKVPEYMVPSVIVPLDSLPLTARGKLDRKALPAPPKGSSTAQRAEGADAAAFVPASTPNERVVESVWKRILGRAEDIDVNCNFLSLGGNSLLAGRVTTLVRKETGSMIPSTAMYQHPTISKIAELCDKHRPDDAGAQGPVVGGNKYRRWGGFSSTAPKTLLFHVFGLLVESFASTAAFLPAYMYLFEVYYEYGKWEAFKLAPFMTGFTLCCVVAYTVLAKRLILGTVRPGEYPLWGPFYLKWWLCHNLHKATVKLIATYVEETPLYNRYLQLMGATIGDRVSIDSDDIFDADLITIEDDVCISRKATIIPHAIENGFLQLWPVYISQHVRVLPVGWVTQGTRVPPGTEVGPLSTTGMSARDMRKGSRLWKGVSAAQNAARLCLIPLTLILDTIAHIPAVLLLEWLWANAFNSYSDDTKYILFCLCIPWVEKLLVAESFFLLTVAYKWLFIGRFKPGKVDKSFSMVLRKWFLERLTHHQQFRFATAPWINTELLAIKYRMLGVTMGFKVQTDYIEVLEFDLLTVGRDCVFGSNVTVCPSDHVENRRVIMQQGAQVLDHSTLMPGAIVGRGALCGSSTIGAKFYKFPPLSISTGNQQGKPVQLRLLTGDPNSEGGLSHLPPAEREMALQALANHRDTTRWAMFNVFNVLTVMLISPVPAVADIITIYAWFYMQENNILPTDNVKLAWAVTILITPPMYFVVQLIEVFLFIAFKWLVVGKYREGNFPFYGAYHRKWVIMMAVKETIGKMLEMFAGTAFYSWFFRAMGSDIGKDVCIMGYGLEYDLFSAGSQSSIGIKCDVTCHTVENMVIKLAATRLHSKCTMRAGALVQPGGVVLDGAVIMENSQVLKGGEVGEDQIYAGLPAEPCQRVLPELAQSSCEGAAGADALSPTTKQPYARKSSDLRPYALILIFVLCLWLLPSILGEGFASSAQDLKVRTTSGLIEGEAFYDTYGSLVGVHYEGIPYADPPVGERRWQPPQPAAHWNEVRPSHRMPTCVDSNGGSEDCLYVDVSVPHASAGAGASTAPALHPVVVWFHEGCGSWARSEGHTAKAVLRTFESPVVVVTPSFRVGAMGFMHHPDVRAGAPTSNLGLLDQRAVLQWVQRNARAFGGDAHNVTLFGQGTAAMWPAAHLVARDSWPLFHRVILQSPPAHALVVSDEAAAVAHARELVAAGPCAGSEDLVRCLKRRPGLDLHTTGMQVHRCRDGREGCAGAAYPTCGDHACAYGLVIDGHDIRDQPWKLLESGEHAGVPVLVGYHSDDGAAGMAGAHALETGSGDGEWQKWARDAFYPIPTEKFESFYASMPKRENGGGWRVS